MQIQGFSKDVEVITKLGDEPNIDDGLSADELRAKFDEGNVAIKQYMNGTLVPATNTALADAGSAKEIAENASILAHLASDQASKAPDKTLKKSGEAADAKVVGDKIDLISDDVQEHDHAIRDLTEGKLDVEGGVISGDLSVQDTLFVGNPESGFYIVSEPIASGVSQMQLYGVNGDDPIFVGGVAYPVGVFDAANKGYVDSAVDAVSKQPGTPGEPGKDGADGGYYTPSVAADGVLSWAGSKPDMPPVQPANIKGSPGADGAPGQDGAPGADGKSAYQLAVEAGFTGTLQEWLASLKGAPGQDGADGSPGADGKGIVSVVRTSGSGAAGTVDTYTITYTDGTTSTFQVWNGENGTNGGYYTPSVSEDGELVFMASKTGMPPVGSIDLHEYISEILPGGYCSTGVAVADKIESYISKEIVAGSLVSIQFANTNTASNPTLTVNGVKAAIVGGNGEAIAPAMLGAGERVFLYTTSQKWVLLNPQVAVLPAATASDAGKVATVGSNGSYGLAYPQYPVVETSENYVMMQPNTYYRCGTMTGLTISFASEIAGIVNEYCGEFYSGSTATNFAVPLSVEWVGGLNIEANKHYQFSVVNGIGVMSGV